MFDIGIDLGGTNIAAGIVDEQGKIIAKQAAPTRRNRTSGEILDDLSNLCLSILEKNNIPKASVQSVGVGCPGNCDPARGMFMYANNIPFDHTPVRDIVQNALNIPVYVENDANCAALGESAAGSAKGYDSSITVTLGTGIGGGIILNGQIFTGGTFGGGEVGHHVILSGGELCNCGRHGCWEAYASATALIRETKKAAQEHPDSQINVLIGGNLENITAKTSFDAAELGDPAAKKILDSYMVYLAEGLANLINIFQPEAIVIGGGICGQGENLLRPVRHYVEKFVYGNELYTKIHTAILGNDAGIVGAAMLHKQDMAKNQIPV